MGTDAEVRRLTLKCRALAFPGGFSGHRRPRRVCAASNCSGLTASRWLCFLMRSFFRVSARRDAEHATDRPRIFVASGLDLDEVAGRAHRPGAQLRGPRHRPHGRSSCSIAHRRRLSSECFSLPAHHRQCRYICVSSIPSSSVPVRLRQFNSFIVSSPHLIVSAGTSASVPFLHRQCRYICVSSMPSSSVPARLRQFHSFSVSPRTSSSVPPGSRRRCG